MKTIASELTNHEDGFLKDKKYLIMDRDSMFSKAFRDFLRGRRREASSATTAQPEFECLYKLILFGETAARQAVRGFLVHYHTERNHLGLGNELIVAMNRPPDIDSG
ncbi:hypothetical protein Q31b_47680 [Novipirellula aureliae]|uniref:Integrase catalytic domain-containing protein n=1 Tax=Novipirellula aureliae TaxID=2527966 RepID=A0A5C6DKZ4_9BACT|nr:hypothetical protein [Novipirellula aureliae]TWU36487.1 hypothetical protein Q31b_47680 [Novipirellula aureliae]